MNELSIGEIIAHSQRIEQESYAFYTRAATFVTEASVAAQLKDLATEEIRHYNLLGSLIEQPRIDEKALAARVAIETDLLNRFVKTHEIGPQNTRREVLEIALEREQATEALYAMLVTFTNLEEPIITLFENLRLQEVGHANRILSLLKE